MIVELLDELTVIGQLHGWEEVDFVEPDMAVGGWTLKAPLLAGNQGLIRTWRDVDLPGIAIRNPETDYRDFGFLTEYTISDRGAEGFELRANGLTFKALLQDRLTWPSQALASWWNYPTSVIGNNLDGIAWSLLVEEMITPPIELYRQPPWPIDPLPVSTWVLPVEQVRLQGMPLLARLRDILAGSGWFVQESLAFSGAGVPQPSIKFEALERPLSTTTFSAREENIADVSVTHRAATATHIIGVGEETASPPAREVRSAQGFDGTWQRRYIERSVNQPSMTGDQLQDQLDRELEEGGPVVSVTATDPNPVIWGQDLRVGWRATVAVPTVDIDYEYLELPVAQQTLTGRAGVWRRELEFGAPSLRGEERLVAALAGIQERQQRDQFGLV